MLETCYLNFGQKVATDLAEFCSSVLWMVALLSDNIGYLSEISKC